MVITQTERVKPLVNQSKIIQQATCVRVYVYMLLRVAGDTGLRTDRNQITHKVQGPFLIRRGFLLVFSVFCNPILPTPLTPPILMSQHGQAFSTNN